MDHFLSVEQLRDKKLLKQLFDVSSKFKNQSPQNYPKPLRHKIIVTLFYEPSTRTRLSFETAIHRLGGKVVSVENAGTSSSKVKGESLEDTIRTINGYADGIVLRHPDDNSAFAAAAVSKIPILNAGSGASHHPTQALLDMYTIYDKKKSIDGLKIGLVGDVLHSRTIQSFMNLLSIYKVELFLIAPKTIQATKKQVNDLKANGAKVSQYDLWDKVIDQLDVLYINRIQQERYQDPKEFERLRESFRVTTETMKKIKEDAIIMDPLPRINEIDPAVDDDPRAIYFEQARNGLFTRMALLNYIFGS